MSRRVEGGMTEITWNDGFSPVIDESSQVLILGSFPSVKSRQVGFYYGNPQNRFWNVLGETFGEIVPNNIDGKKDFLKKHKIALWDIYVKARIKGSSDSDINESTGKTGNVADLLEKYPKIKTVVCNGKKAYTVTVEALSCRSINILYFSSTSSANPRFTECEWVDGLRKILKTE